MSRHSNIVIVTGTDTDVGKTWVTAALARALVAAGRRVVALKAVEVGAGRAGTTEDGVLLAEATGQAGPRGALVRFTDDLAPAVAAEREGRSIDFDEMLLGIEKAAAGADLVLVEGSGGLLTPITWEWCIVDIAQALEARALLVAADRLGTLNHALLTLGALELAAVPVTHLVLNAPAVPDASTGHNAGAIRRLAGFSRIVEVPRTDDANAAAAALAGVAAELLG